MNPQAQGFQPARRTARLLSGLLGAAIGLGVIVSVVDGMAANSGGESLGQLIANQRAIAQSPVAQAPRAGMSSPAL